MKVISRLNLDRWIQAVLTNMKGKLLSSLTTFRWRIQQRDTFAILLGLIPCYLIIVLIDRYAVNVPYWDIWDLSVSRYALDVPFSFNDFWHLQNEHRIFLPQMIDMLIAKTTSLDMITRNYAKVPVVVLSYIALYTMYRRKADSRASPLIIIPFSLLTFTLAYWPAWIQPVILATPLSILSFLFAIWAITAITPGWRALILAALMGYISSLSFATGNATWIVIGVVMWFVGYRELRHYVAWGIISLSVLLPYGYDLLQSQTILRTTPIGDLSSLLDYFLAFVGAPLAVGDYLIQIRAKTMGIVGVVGIIFLAIGITRYIKDGSKKMLPWLGIAAWVLIGGAASAVGRAAIIGVEGANAPRYALLQSFFWIAFVAMMAIALTEPRRSMNREEHGYRFALMDLLPMGMALIIGIGFVNTSLYKLEDETFDDFTIQLTEGRSCLFMYQTAEDSCLQLLYPNAKRIRELMPNLVARDASFLFSRDFIVDQAIVDALSPEETYQTSRLINGETVKVIFQHPPSSLTWRFRLPKNNETILLNTGLLIDVPEHYDVPPSDGVLFRVTVTLDGQRKDLLEKFILPSEYGQGFEPIQIDLSKYRGEAISLTFMTNAGINENAHTNYDWAMWLGPELSYK